MNASRPEPGVLEDSFRTFGHFVRDAVRVLQQHWPQLACLSLIGWSGRMTFLWAATVISDWNPTVADIINWYEATLAAIRDWSSAVGAVVRQRASMPWSRMRPCLNEASIL